MAREINLVPDIKDEMLKALKMRNFIFFLCIAVAAVSAGITLIFGLIAGGQQIAINNKKDTIDNLSSKLNSYSDLDDFLTIKDQLNNLQTLTDNKQVLSRTFNVLSALLPTGADTITVSELTVNLGEGGPVLVFDAQANAGKAPFIDYNVLDSFKKSMQYMRYDYGNYVDKEGNKIPAYCMIETGTDGAILRDGSKGIYAYWTINAEGCKPGDSNTKYNTEGYDGKTVVKVWRTPQFSDWYKQKYLTLDGSISGVPHFESACVSYTGEGESAPKWTESNEGCKLVPNGTEGITISESSNGRDAAGELVLRFSANIALAPEVYRFNNDHMLALPPSGRFNVTDSYVQVQAMFGKRAVDCAEGDTSCSNNAANRGED